jgi:hypothetical protein
MKSIAEVKELDSMFLMIKEILNHVKEIESPKVPEWVTISLT